MNSGRSDASTSTDDVKGRPLCLFYFTQPFGVLSPEPPTLTAAPPHIARAFLNMEPVSPFFWSPATATATATEESYRSTATGESFDLGPATVHRHPVSVVCPSALWPTEVWPPPAAGCGSPERRCALRYCRTLPPLRLPSPPARRRARDVWPAAAPRVPPGKFSLPPLSLPAPPRPPAPQLAPAPPSARSGRARRRLGVHKQRRRRTDLRRMVSCLVRRAVRGGEESSPSPGLARVLRTIREAWAPPASLRYPRGTVNRSLYHVVAPPAQPQPVMQGPTGTLPRRDASPGLLRRRYSVPETIMRKYRLAQQSSDSEESGAATHHGAASACPSPPRDTGAGSPADSPHRFLRRDRELMRKSALLRRMWTRPCHVPTCCCAETRPSRSLDGSRADLPRAPSASPKRQRLTAAADLSDSTFRSHRVGRDLSFTGTPTDAYSDSEPSRLGSGGDEPSSSPPTAPTAEAVAVRGDTSTGGTDPFSMTGSTAKDTSDSTEAPAPATYTSCEPSARTQPVFKRAPLALPPPAPPPYELLEIVVSESSDAAAAAPVRVSLAASSPFSSVDVFDVDEYVSHILVESLNSLTDQLECMNASIGGDRRISVVEKEIKVKLQNAAVNTIVHLSPTSNNQIIFGNEELCNDPRRRDECNNPLTVREESTRADSDGELTSTGVSPRPLSTEQVADNSLPPPTDAVNRAVLQQIQKLFRDELRSLEAAGAGPAGETCDVDAYMEGRAVAGEPRSLLEITTRSADDLIGGVGAGNYFRDGGDSVAVPRFSAYPNTESMEVNTSSSDDAEAVCSDCTSLVDSLEDPNSPRGAACRRIPSSADPIHLMSDRVSDARPEAFFVRIEGDEETPDVGRVAEYMPERIKQRLHRRHRKRELRIECARRSKVKQLKQELERHRREDEARTRRQLERDCAAVVAALVDDVIARVAHEEFKRMRSVYHLRCPSTARSEESLVRRNRRREPNGSDRKRDGDGPRAARRHSCDKENRRVERHQVHGKLVARPSLAPGDRPPRRIYQKSEIHEGEKCIEILEILEYVNGTPSSPDTANSDENHNLSWRCKKSRIPIPVFERMKRGEPRLRPPSEFPAMPPPEPRSRSNSLRFQRVFDIIPEERSSISLDSSEDVEGARRASAPEVCALMASPPPGPAPAPSSPRRARSTRSAGTSPLAEAEERARRLRSQTTMTSPCSRSAATSPLRLPAPPASPPSRPAPPPPRPAREGGEERRPRAGSARRGHGGGGGGSSSDSGDSGGSLLCSLAPRWLAHGRPRRRPRRAAPPATPPPHPLPPPHTADDTQGTGAESGGWSVTVAGTCRAALPADVEMRLRFPHELAATATAAAARPASRALIPPHHTRNRTECACVQCAVCAAGSALPPAHTPAPLDARLTLTMKKEEQDSSILASKSVRKSCEQLPELETYRAARTKLKSSVKTRRGYSLHCWLPAADPAPIRASNGLSVLGCAIIPELKPRVPTMSERDLTRVYTPRHYLRS